MVVHVKNFIQLISLFLMQAKASKKSLASKQASLMMLAFCLVSFDLSADRLKDIANVQGVRANQLVGYGLVVGLDGTGDNTPFTSQTFRNLMTKFGITIPNGVDPKAKNVAAVSIHAELPPFAKPGQKIDITASSLGDSKSLRGGSLIMTPLKGADGRVYAMAQGSLIVGGFGAEGADGSSIKVNVPSVGRIPNGATVELAIASPFHRGDTLTFDLHRADFTTAMNVTEQINDLLGPSTAYAQDASSITVKAPRDASQRVSFLSMLENLNVETGEEYQPAKASQIIKNLYATGLFSNVTVGWKNSNLIVEVEENPLVNKVAFEGNEAVVDERFAEVISLKSRGVYTPAKVQRDVQTILAYYRQKGFFLTTVTPQLIKRDQNRVDLVFEVFEGGLTEIERLGFAGNQVYSDGRLRRVLETKQAGLLRAFVTKDTFVPDRIEFDKQVLRDFYLSRGYVDFRTTGVNAELARERDGYFVTFNVEEGQQFRFGAISTVSEVDGADADEFQAALKVRPGVVYSPSLVENSIARLERLAILLDEGAMRCTAR